MALLHAPYVGGEVAWEIEYAVSLAVAYEVAGLVDGACAQRYADIGRGIKLAGELAALGLVGVIYQHHRHLSHHLVIVYP